MKSKSELARIAPALSDEVCGVVVYMSKTGSKTLTFKCHVDLAKGFAPGDWAICHGGPHGEFSVLKVASVEPSFDPEPDIEYKWIVDRLDVSTLSRFIAWENELVDALYSAQRAHARESMRAALGFDQDVPRIALEAPEETPPPAPEPASSKSFE